MGKPEPIPQKRKSSGFASDVLKLATGTTFAQALSILVAPILARIYAPDAFGTTAVFVSITSIIIIISCMRYELAIMLPETDEEAANLVGLSLVIVLVISLLTVVVVWIGKNPLLHWLNAPELAPYLWLIPPTVFVNGLLLILNYWNSRTKRFGRLSIAQVVNSFTTIGGKLGSGLAGFTTTGSLIGASLIGSITTVTTLSAQTWRNDGQLLSQSITLPQMVTEMKRYRKFPMFNIWAGLLNVVSWQLPVFFLSSFFSTTIVGYYALGNRILRLPMSLIGQSIGQVFYQRASATKDEGELTIIVENVFQQLVKLGMFPSLMLTLIGQDIFTFVFGESWAEAGVYVQILALWTFVWFISSPLSSLFSVLERQEFGLYINILVFISRLLALILGGYLGDARLMLLLFGVSGILVYGLLNVIVMKMAGVTLKSILRILSSTFILFIPSGLITIGLHSLHSPTWLVLGVSGISFGIYIAYIMKTDPQLRKLLNRFGILEKMGLGA